jgi:hypothetical protein
LLVLAPRTELNTALLSDTLQGCMDRSSHPAFFKVEKMIVQPEKVIAHLNPEKQRGRVSRRLPALSASLAT